MKFYSDHLNLRLSQVSHSGFSDTFKYSVLCSFEVIVVSVSQAFLSNAQLILLFELIVFFHILFSYGIHFSAYEVAAHRLYSIN